MLNSEHYSDPTASMAVNEVAKQQPMRFNSTPSYVADTTHKPWRIPYQTIPVEEMCMDELKPYINSCAKSKRDPMICIDCNPGCVFGRRAIELMEQATKPIEEKKVNPGTIANRQRSIREYQAAIASGDVMKYAIEHAKSPDMKRAKAAASARVAFWRKKYGALIKETPVVKQEPALDEILADEKHEEEPHLMQMPCLSKKVAAEREAAAKEAEASAGITQVFASKLKSLRDELAGIQSRIDGLLDEKNTIEKQISAIEATAGMLNVKLE